MLMNRHSLNIYIHANIYVTVRFAIRDVAGYLQSVDRHPHNHRWRVRSLVDIRSAAANNTLQAARRMYTFSLLQPGLDGTLGLVRRD